MKWVGVTIHDEVKTVLQIDGVGVARMSERLGGTWFVYLWYHHGFEDRVTRNCSSFEQGRAGVEMWAQRHMDTLCREVAEINAASAARRVRYASESSEPYRPVYGPEPRHPGRPKGQRRGRKPF
ncbi:hypothetical protein LDO31_03150 [Luteimonas sp. XNQY3]|nr:hypothetical protein [Luteimonas sp. XNQY3]MCD9005245.1 hypothetical protein [Luteimonas sp. XNQY3]